MSLEFDAPPLTRRERREREALLIAQGATADQAAELAGHTGVIVLGNVQAEPIASADEQDSTSVSEAGDPAAVTPAHDPAPAAEAELVADTEPAADTGPAADAEPAAETEPVAKVGFFSRRALRSQAPVETETEAEPEPEPEPASVEDAPDAVEPAEANSAQADAEPVGAPIAERAASETIADTGEPVDSEPVDSEPVVDVQMVEVIEQILSNEPSDQESPLGIPPEPGTDTGAIHWTDALSLPVNVDPTDPASMPDLPAFTSDTNTIVLDEMPDVTALSTHTGEIELMMTGSILLPTELTETGALPDVLDSSDVEQNEDISDELPLSSLTPKSAAAAVNAAAETPAMVSEPAKQRMGTGAVIALTAGGAAGVVLIALGVGALFHLF